MVCFSLPALLILALVAALSLGLNGGSAAAEAGGQSLQASTAGEGSVSGVFTGTSTGFGGEIAVEITVEHGQIVGCSITAEGETPSVGGRYIGQFEQQIASEGKADAVSGATLTSNGVKAALQQALQAAGLARTAEYQMAPGTYLGEARGFSSIDTVKVQVTVSEREILSVELVEDFRENPGYEDADMCRGAFETLGPEIVACQSVAVDSVTGATGSSGGIKNAVRSALTSAFMANGLSQEEAAEAVNSMFTGAGPEKKTDMVELHYDVVVVGAGATGAIASLTALDEGASVLNVEKTFRWGGQSMMIGGPKVYNEDITDEELDAVYQEYQTSLDNHRYGDDARWNDPDYRAAHADEFTDVNEEAYKAAAGASGKGAKTFIQYGMHLVVGEPFLASIPTSMGGLLEVGDDAGMPDMSAEAAGMPDMSAMPEGFDPSAMPEGFDPGAMMGGGADAGGMDMSAAMPGASTVDDSQALTVEGCEEFTTDTIGTTLEYSMAKKYFEVVFDNYVEAGGDYLLNTTAKELIYADDTKQEIIGLRAYADDGTTYEIYADAIVLATGGYGGNDELMDQWAAGGEDWLYYGWQGNDGDGILMALDAGANPYNLEAYPMSHQRMAAQFLTTFDVETTDDGTRWSPNDIPQVLAVNSDGVYLTLEGESFISEEESAMFPMAMSTYHLGAGYYVVYSEDQLESYASSGIANVMMGFQGLGEGVPANYPLGDWVNTVLEEAARQGWAWKVSSLEEGDRVLGIPDGSLASAYAADGTALNHDGDASYYIIKCTGLAIASCGGVEVNEKMQAVRTDGTVIENLFVAGNDAFGNIMATGAEYPIGGDAHMFAFGSGSVAGEEAARIAARK